MLNLRLTLYLMLLLTASCASNLPDTTIDKWCERDAVITVSDQDKMTPGTERQILAHNIIGQRLCKW